MKCVWEMKKSLPSATQLASYFHIIYNIKQYTKLCKHYIIHDSAPNHWLACKEANTCQPVWVGLTDQGGI